ncbi:MAG TPA: hypothetical protein VK308_03655 [Pyrinomonadaceae bacterium]|nr:hypothetical protein [Pyrinomonadaceae bacterium]
MSILGNIAGLQKLAAIGDKTARQQLAAVGLWTSDDLREERAAAALTQPDNYLPKAELFSLAALEDSILIGEGASFDPDTGEMLDAEFLPRGLEAFGNQSAFKDSFVIRHRTAIDDETGEPLYWVNNTQGFCGWATLRSLSEKDFYTSEEARRFGMRLVIEGVWETWAIARQRIVQCGSCAEVFLKGELNSDECSNCFSDDLVGGFIDVRSGE